MTAIAPVCAHEIFQWYKHTNSRRKPDIQEIRKNNSSDEETEQKTTQAAGS